MKKDYEHVPRLISDEVWRLFHLAELVVKVLSLVSLMLMPLTTKLTTAC